MLDGALSDSEVAGLLRGIALVKWLILSDDLYVDIDQASEMTCCSPEFLSVLPSRHLAATGGIFLI